MVRKIAKPHIGARWFIRNKGAAALQVVDLLDYYNGNVWQLRTLEICAYPYYAQAKVDFEFVRPFPTPEKP